METKKSTPESIRFEAALLFVSGNFDEAKEKLINEINMKQGNADKSIWHLLFDVYLSRNQKRAYENLAVFYIQQFNLSPPAWDPFTDDGKSEGAGRNSLVVDGSPALLSDIKCSDFISSCQKESKGRIDLSRIRVDDEDIELESGIGKLIFVLKEVRLFKNKFNQPFRGVVMGSDNIIDELSLKLKTNKSATNLNKIYYLFLLELLQWKRDKNNFENKAYEFTKLFELSPPSYEPTFPLEESFLVQSNNDSVLNIVKKLNSNGHNTDVLDVVDLPSDIETSNINDIITSSNKFIGNNGFLVLNAKNTKRISFEAVTELCEYIKKINLDKSKIILMNATEIVLTMFEGYGCLQLLTVRPRKR